jgi:hypothetical protein
MINVHHHQRQGPIVAAGSADLGRCALVKAHTERSRQLPELDSASVVDGKLRADITEIEKRVAKRGDQANASGSVRHNTPGRNSNVQIGLSIECSPTGFKKVRAEGQGLLEADDLTSGEPGTEIASQFRVPGHVVDCELAGVLNYWE